MEPQYIIIGKEIFEKLVSDSAEQEQRTHRVIWGDPHHIIAPTIFGSPEGDVFLPTLTIEYPDEPKVG